MRVRAGSAGLGTYLIFYFGLPLFGALCLGWSLIALPARLLLPPRAGAVLGRRGICRGFRWYLAVMVRVGAIKLDTRALEELAQESSVVLAPNHPGLFDAILLLAYHPDMVCIMKSAMLRNPFLGPGARLARFIGNAAPRRMIGEAVAAVRSGAALLLFPEGTRTVRNPVNRFQLTVGTIAKHAQAPILTLLIETDSPYLSKGWPLFRVPSLPITYRVRLGRRFAPPRDVRRFTRELEQYFRAELDHSTLNSWLPGHVGSHAPRHPAPRGATEVEAPEVSTSRTGSLP
ncbi:MAG TPA: lysophospholipid acyltransferase family protein [Opitutaceae bacterium]|nr:lysophospholipid acyltransferase family protein [Opitutaceae bacterium]